MTFTPPVLSTLMVKTRNLDTEFSKKLGRYKINAPEVVTDSSEPQKSAPQKQSNLEVLIARTQKVVECESRRDTQRDVFSQLLNELREVLKNKNETQCNRAAMFLLGALLHRYFRLLQNYDDYNKSVYFFSPWNVRSCTLFIAIRKALKLHDSMIGDFRARDLDILDNTTIVTALKAFRDNMLIEDEKKIPRYKKYPHLEQDVNFQKHLKEIIEKYEELGAPVIRQFKAVNFIQSLAAQVDEEHLKVERALEAWSKRLLKEHSDFASLINIEMIEQHINNTIDAGPVREKILDLLYAPHIKENFNTFKHENFLEALKTCNANAAIYTVVGGYALLLQSKNINDVRFCLNEALGIETTPGMFDKKEMLLGINFLERYFEINPQAKLNYEFFDNKDRMDTLIIQKREELSGSTDAKSNQVNDQSVGSFMALQ